MLTVAGEALIDLIVAPDGSVRAAVGGGPFNAARTAARLGRPPGSSVGCPTDRFGDQLLATLLQDGVTPLVEDRIEAPSTLAVAEVDVRGAASYRFYVQGTSAPALLPTDVQRSYPSRALHVGSLGLVLEPMADTIEQLVRVAADDTTVLVDLNCRPAAIRNPDRYRERIEFITGRADIVKASTEDLEFLHPGIAPLQVAAKLVARGPMVVLLTDGSDAAHVVHRDGSTRLAVRRVAVVDTVGAGDAFGAAFLAWWLRHDHTRADLADRGGSRRRGRGRRRGRHRHLHPRRGRPTVGQGPDVRRLVNRRLMTDGLRAPCSEVLSRRSGDVGRDGHRERGVEVVGPVGRERGDLGRVGRRCTELGDPGALHGGGRRRGGRVGVGDARLDVGARCPVGTSRHPSTAARSGRPGRGRSRWSPPPGSVRDDAKVVRV